MVIYKKRGWCVAGARGMAAVGLVGVRVKTRVRVSVSLKR